jgi:hypothetical protein
MQGQFDLGLIDLAWSPALMSIMYQAFSWLVPIIMMNLLIALMGGSYERVETSASDETQRKRAELIVGFEKFMTADHHDPVMFPKSLHFFMERETTASSGKLDNGVVNGVARRLDELKAHLDDRVNRLQAQVKDLTAAHASEVEQVRPRVITMSFDQAC